jgi:hypothetical protein
LAAQGVSEVGVRVLNKEKRAIEARKDVEDFAMRSGSALRSTSKTRRPLHQFRQLAMLAAMRRAFLLL